jgi:hypothetical protein
MFGGFRYRGDCTKDSANSHGILSKSCPNCYTKVVRFGLNRAVRGFIFVNFFVNIKILQVSLSLRVLKPRGVWSAI